MNRTRTSLLLAAALSLAASAVAGPSPAYFAFPPSTSRAKTPALVKSPPAASAVAPAPGIFLVSRGGPKSLSSGLTYVDAEGHELSKSRTLALEKVAAHTLASTESEHAAKKAGGFTQ